MKDITIELNPDQRFLLEVENDGSLMMVDKITIFPHCTQMTVEGVWFNLDYEDMKIDASKGRHYMQISMEQDTTWSDEE